MKEFFHGKSQRTLDNVKVGFLIGAFVVPFILVAVSMRFAMPIVLLIAAFAIQYAGLVAERWFFFAEARHPQNIYYQQAS